MTPVPFVAPTSIVRRIWGDADVMLLIFAGASAEFALNKAVDWLFFTGKLPADPIGRLFSTVTYAQQLVFASQADAHRTLAQITFIHRGVETKRGYAIPDWAYRDVLYMLIDYSERAFACLHRPLTPAERAELFAVFEQVGQGMGIPDLPGTYADWQTDRQAHLQADLARSAFTDALFRRYAEALGSWRFALLRQAQGLLIPPPVARLLPTPRPWLGRCLWLYGVVNALGMRRLMQRILLPTAYLAQIRVLDRTATPELFPQGET